MCECMYIDIYISLYVFICMYVHIYVCMYICVCICMRMYRSKTRSCLQPLVKRFIHLPRNVTIVGSYDILRFTPSSMLPAIKEVCTVYITVFVFMSFYVIYVKYFVHMDVMYIC